MAAQAGAQLAKRSVANASLTLPSMMSKTCMRVAAHVGSRLASLDLRLEIHGGSSKLVLSRMRERQMGRGAGRRRSGRGAGWW
ncbi:hypothetical protein PR202_ga29929 [Eleusine coracana subsp. coracana]|uniref:Uncharacterized protein n=1 Tax=Eleusine coracana subsp. coracana TaxID=191504 RepID=A0AAV5DMF0_ELECO|nr:hypothetical protein PR202_ga29929 [Eleusine coracana subsp. coracana]